MKEEGTGFELKQADWDTTLSATSPEPPKLEEFWDQIKISSKKPFFKFKWKN